MKKRGGLGRFESGKESYPDLPRLFTPPLLLRQLLSGFVYRTERRLEEAIRKAIYGIQSYRSFH